MSKKSKHILVVDDDDDDRRFFCLTLHQVSNEIGCLRAANGREAFLYLQDKSNPSPDLIFLDINMPVMTGWEFLTRVKQVKELEGIPIIVYSTSSSQRDVNIAYDLGAFSYCVKFDRPEMLKDMLRFISENIQQFHFPLLQNKGKKFFQFPQIH